MCYYSRWIKSAHDGRLYYVNCGHCEPCLQQKSLKRKRRITNEGTKNLCYFVTLHYKNEFVPYIKESEYRNFYYNRYNSTLPVYRGDDMIARLSLDDFSSPSKCSLPITDFPQLKYMTKYVNGRPMYLVDKVSVCWLRDIQLFFKRLKINLLRAHYNKYFSYFYTTDYGDTYHRAHIHTLIYFDRDFEQTMRHAICSSWPYADLSQPVGRNDRQPIEIAQNPANYVASYVNSVVNVPAVLSQVKPFKVRYHFSNFFGQNLAEFSLPSLLEKVRQGTLYYHRTAIKNGVFTISATPVPNYVLSRYWPKFKRYSYLSANEIIQLVELPQSCFFFDFLDFDEKVELYKMLSNLKCRIPKNYYYEWLNVYPYVWSLYQSNLIRASFDDVSCLQDLFYHYNNISSYYIGRVGSLFLDDCMKELPLSFSFQLSPKKFPRNISLNERYTTNFYRSFKHHQIKTTYYDEKL